MDAYLARYRHDGDPTMLRRIVPWIVAWHSFRQSAPKQDRPFLDSLSGMRACRLAIVVNAYRAGLLDLSESEWDTIYAVARADARWLSTPGNIAPMNHAYFQIAGLDRLGHAFDDDPVFRSAQDLAARKITELIESQFTPEGVHVENSPSYHYYALSQIERSGAEEMLALPTQALIHRARSVLPWLVCPDGTYAQVGDSGDVGQPLTNADGNTATLDDTEYAVAPFWRSGYAVIRSHPDVPSQDASMLLLAGTSHSHVHSHADKLTFILYEYGCPLLVDTGKYGYRRDAMRSYVESDAAHNILGLADEPLLRRNALLGETTLDEPRISPDGFLLGGRTEWHAPHPFTYSRNLTYWPRRHLKIRDRINGDRHARYASRLHFDQRLHVEQHGNVLVADFGSGHLLRAELKSAGWDLALYRGRTAATSGTHLGWQSVDYLKMTPTFTAEAIAAGRDVSCEWLITID